MIIQVIPVKDNNFLDALFFDPDLQLKDMQKGLTNKNYLLTLDGEEYVLRIPFADAANVVDRHHETLALQALKDSDIDVDTIYYDEVNGYKVTRYLKDVVTYEECIYEDKIERVAALMKRFHGLHTTIGVSFDPIGRYVQYARHVKHQPFAFPMLNDLIKELQHMKRTQVLCHNDWVSGNILFTPAKTYLIDYEYAADNDPLFDVMSFLSENNIQDETLRERFYAVYFDTMDDQLRKDLLCFEAFEDVLWCHWALMMFESRQDPVYMHIAKAKAQGYNNVINKWKAYQ